MDRISDWLENQRLSWVMLALVAIGIAALALQTNGMAFRHGRADLWSYLLSAKALQSGGNPYATASPFPYIYPLFLAFVLVPLAVAPYVLAVWLWFAASVASLVASSLLIIRVAAPQRPIRSRPPDDTVVARNTATSDPPTAGRLTVAIPLGI